MIEGRILPWVQDSSADGYPVWSDFGANQRDVFFLNYEGIIDTSFNSTPYNPSDPDDVLFLTNLILSMREDDPVIYTGPVWHVDDAGSNETGDGSESNPFATIQLGIDSAVEGDTVLVEPGTYYTSNSIYNKNIILGSRYLMTADTSYISTTIIDGTGEGCPLMIYGSAITDACRVTGLTIQNGTTGCVYGQGGGLYVEGADPRLDNLIIKNNHSTNFGGGICIKFDSSPLLDDIIIKNNTADELGGGIYVDYNASPVMNNIEIVNNSALHGGGIFVSQSSQVIINNTLIAQNYERLDIPDYPIDPTEGYGAIETTGATISLNNCTITDNLGVGMIVKNGSQVTMINSIYWFNEPIMMTDSSGQETNILSVSYSDIQFGWDGEGNIDMNPRFCRPEDMNYYLSANSPAVGVGENGSNMGAFNVDCEAINLTQYISNAGSDDTGDGSENNPFETIQQGIDSSIDGDTVLVDPGDYCAFDYLGKNIFVTSKYLINDDINLMNQTEIIDCNNYYDNNHSGYINFSNGEDSSAVLSGFLINGIPLVCYNSSPTLMNLKIMNYGGGITPYDPFGEQGAALMFDSSSATINHLIVSNNNKISHELGGAAALIRNSNIEIKNSLIANNNSQSPGHGLTEYTGGIVAINSSIHIDKSTFYGNSSGNGYGTVGPGALFLDTTSTSIITNSIFWENGIYPIIGSSSISFSDIEGGWDGQGNINLDPLFCLSDSTDFTIAANSPCIGTGENGSNMGAFGLGCNISVDWDFSIGVPNIIIDGNDGDWNPGESISIEMDFCNNSDIGHMFYPGVILESDTNLISISNSHYWFYGMDPNTCNTVNFFVAADSSISSDTVLTFSAYAEALNCENQPEYCIAGDTVSFDISILVENTEMSINEDIPLAFKVYNAYPNPFNPITSIGYDLPEDGFINITIYSMMGNIVKTLVNGTQTAGNKTIQWNATNDKNEPVSAGLYLYTIQTGELRQTKKMILLK